MQAAELEGLGKSRGVDPLASQKIKYEESNLLLRDPPFIILERWARWLRTLLTNKPPTIDTPNADELHLNAGRQRTDQNLRPRS